MRIADRYIGLALLRGLVLVLVGLVLLMSLAALVKELDDVGKGRYTFMDALSVVVLMVPQRAFDLAPVSGLVGAIMGLGALAAGNEILAFRASGMSPVRIGGACLKTALPLMILLGLTAEFVIPPATSKAERQRRIAVSGLSAALSGQALWFRDGDAIIRLGIMREEGASEDIQIFDFDESGSLREVIRARTGVIEESGVLTLHDVRRQGLQAPAATISLESLAWRTSLKAETIGLVSSSPESLSLTNLRRVLVENPTGDPRFATLLWRKLSVPFLFLALLILALPFVIGSGAGATRGRRLALGAVVGVLAYLMVQVIAYVGEILALDPRIVAVTPVALALVTAWVLLERIR